ncbi:MAG: hypothetical protein LBN94_01010 [Puniceicoccales bacterium]|jgi:hypothetical protein|nr:hypothetical protein [Puniceicoccales bacterium]
MSIRSQKPLEEPVNFKEAYKLAMEYNREVKHKGKIMSKFLAFCSAFGQIKLGQPSRTISNAMDAARWAGRSLEVRSTKTGQISKTHPFQGEVKILTLAEGDAKARKQNYENMERDIAFSAGEKTAKAYLAKLEEKKETKLQEQLQKEETKLQEQLQIQDRINKEWAAGEPERAEKKAEETRIRNEWLKTPEGRRERLEFEVAFLRKHGSEIRAEMNEAERRRNEARRGSSTPPHRS